MSDSNRDSDDQETENEKLKRKLKVEARKYKTKISKLKDEIEQKDDEIEDLKRNLKEKQRWKKENSGDETNEARDVINELKDKMNNMIEKQNEMNILIQNQNERLQSISNENERLQSNIIESKDLLNPKEIIDELKDEIKKMNQNKKFSLLDSVVIYKLKFQIANQFDETELFVSKFDNVIKLKKSICDGNMNDYKRMIMKYKGDTLDNNKFILSCIDSTNIYPIFCEFDDNIDVDSTIMIKLKCDNIYPEMLQIWKYQTIKHLKMIIFKANYKDLLIFYKSNQLDDDDKSIDYYKIRDNDTIYVLNKSQQMQNISMKSIFSAKDKISVEISKIETVSNLINKSIQKMRHEMATNHFAVFLNKKLMENEKFLYEYNIDSKSSVEFCYMKNMSEIENRLPVRDFDRIQLFRGRNINFDCPVLLRGYHRMYFEYMGDNYFSMLMKEMLPMFQITKSHPRFIQVYGVYKDADCFYVEINSTKESMKNFLLNNNEISTYQISKWANQILEGLKHLHNHNIILKTLNPMDIWLDGNHDVKLPSFNLTEYLNHLGDEKYRHRDGALTCVALEILESKPYESSADVWSLGAVMIDAVTGGQLYRELTESKIVQNIKENRTIEYDKTNKPKDLINFIGCCVKEDPKERSTIDQLMKHEFIQKYL